MLTKEDATTIQGMIDKSLAANNDVLMSRIIDAIKDFATKDDLKREVEGLATKEGFYELKDEVAGLRKDLDNFMVFTTDNFQLQQRDINLIKVKLHLSNV